jgi:hypothetical protein
MKSTAVGRLQIAFWALGVLWFVVLACYPNLFRFFAVDHYGHWFLDSAAILASNDAVALGLDPHRPNALDVFNRPHVYTHWWLSLHHLGLTRAHNLAFGFFIVAVFLGAALARLNPRKPGELLWYFAVLSAPGVLLAVNRANNDLVVFVVLAPIVPCLLDGRRLVRMFAVVLIGVAAGLKFYPAAAALVLLAPGFSPVRETRERVFLAVLVLALVALDLRDDLSVIGGLAPTAFGLTTFGAGNLLSAFGLQGGAGVAATSGVFVVTIAMATRWRPLDSWVIAPEDRGAWLSFVLGAVLLTGCFFAGTNFGYRWIFALWLAPFLWQIWRNPSTPRELRRLGAITAGLLLFALWADALASLVIGRLLRGANPDLVFQRADQFFKAEQPVTWALFVCLLIFLTHFARLGLKELFGRSILPPQ